MGTPAHLTSLICPVNDGESKTIVDIALKLNMDVRVSHQPWGAVLSKEPPETFQGLMENVVIVEIPGPEEEDRLRLDHRLFIIDHHRYQSIDRSNPLSSLEQFANLVSYDLNRWEMGVAINDRSYIYGLQDNGYTDKEIQELRQFDLAQQGYKSDDFSTLEADYLRGRLIVEDLYLVETKFSRNSYLADLHLLRSGKTPERLDLLVAQVSSANKISEINFYGTPGRAKRLYQAIGGFSGGDESRSMYWGKTLDPPVDEKEFLSSLLSSLTNLKKE